MQQRYIATLDGWRAIAVLLVIGAHASRLMRDSHSWAGDAAARFFDHAGYGVDIFFALSGFLICSLLLEEKRRGAISLKGFYLRRGLRILPAMLLYLLALATLGMFGALPIGAEELGSVLVFLRNYADGGWYTAHFWSLAVEEHFYIVVPLVLALCTAKRALWIAVAAALVCIVIRYVEWLYLEGKVEFRTESRFDALMFGCVFAILRANESSRVLLARWLTLRNVAVVVVLALAILVALPAMPARRTVVAILLPIVLGYTILHPTEWVGRALEVSWLRWIGRLSYSLYIWQMLFFVPKVDLPLWQSMPGALLGTVSCALLSFYLVEGPAIAWGRAFMTRRNNVHEKLGELLANSSEIAAR